MDTQSAAAIKNSNKARNSIRCNDYGDVIILAMASQITGASSVCSTVWSGAGEKKTSTLRVTGLCEG